MGGSATIALFYSCRTISEIPPQRTRPLLTVHCSLSTVPCPLSPVPVTARKTSHARRSPTDHSAPQTPRGAGLRGGCRTRTRRSVGIGVFEPGFAQVIERRHRGLLRIGDQPVNRLLPVNVGLVLIVSADGVAHWRQHETRQSRTRRTASGTPPGRPTACDVPALAETPHHATPPGSRMPGRQ